MALRPTEPPAVMQDPSGVYVRLPPELAVVVADAVAEGRQLIEKLQTARGAVCAFLDAVSALDRRRRRR